jgi:hypothetical protein
MALLLDIGGGYEVTVAFRVMKPKTLLFSGDQTVVFTHMTIGGVFATICATFDIEIRTQNTILRADAGI